MLEDSINQMMLLLINFKLEESLVDLNNSFIQEAHKCTDSHLKIEL